MADDDDRPILQELEAMNVVAPDPRLERWAADASSPEEREALLREAESDPELAAQLERLRPLEGDVRELMVAAALAELGEPAPEAEVLPFRRKRSAPAIVAAALAAAAAVAIVLTLPERPRVELLEAPAAGRPVPADETVTLAVRSASGDAPPPLSVVMQDELQPVPLEWDAADGILSVTAPAHLLTAGRYGAVELDVGGLRVPLTVEMPAYALREGVAMLAERKRSLDAIVRDGSVVVPADAAALRLTLRPRLAVRSPVKACAFVETESGRSPIAGSCRTVEDGLVELELEASSIEGAIALVFELTPSSGSVAPRIVRAPIVR